MGAQEKRALLATELPQCFWERFERPTIIVRWGESTSQTSTRRHIMTALKSTLHVTAVLALMSLIGTAPALAFTRHPATPEEIKQTDALNAQSLANAKGTNSTQMTAVAPPGSVATTETAQLSQMLPVPSSLANATVQSQTGDTVGSVQKIVTGTDGKPAMVEVALTGNTKVVAISADKFVYDAQKNVLVASLSMDEIKSLPATNS
jgi:hypothetical protein